MYSIDTNIVIGLINKQDRLHRMAVSFCIEKSKKSQILLLSKVIIEAKKTFLKYYNQALSEIQQIAFSEIPEKEKAQKTNSLPESKPLLSNFYKRILFELNNDFSADNFAIVKQKPIKAINNLRCEVYKQLNMKNPALARPSEQKSKEQESFLRKQEIFKFSDSNDKEIFTEFIFYHYQYKEKSEFYSNDENFIKQANKAKQQLQLEKALFYQIKEKQEKPFYEVLN